MESEWVESEWVEFEWVESVRLSGWSLSMHRCVTGFVGSCIV